jgi:hypothetical protein
MRKFLASSFTLLLRFDLHVKIAASDFVLSDFELSSTHVRSALFRTSWRPHFWLCIFRFPTPALVHKDYSTHMDFLPESRFFLTRRLFSAPEWHRSPGKALVPTRDVPIYQDGQNSFSFSSSGARRRRVRLRILTRTGLVSSAEQEIFGVVDFS